MHRWWGAIHNSTRLSGKLRHICEAERLQHPQCYAPLSSIHGKERPYDGIHQQIQGERQTSYHGPKSNKSGGKDGRRSARACRGGQGLEVQYSQFGTPWPTNYIRRRCFLRLSSTREKNWGVSPSKSKLWSGFGFKDRHPRCQRSRWVRAFFFPTLIVCQTYCFLTDANAFLNSRKDNPFKLDYGKDQAAEGWHFHQSWPAHWPFHTTQLWQFWPETFGGRKPSKHV